jgi:hypothetical protein
MGRKFFICFILSLFITQSAIAIEPISLGEVEKEQIEINKTPKVIKGSMVIDNEIVLKELVEYQKTKDLEDIENLWKGTVENDKIIEFTLKKLASPDSQKRIHSSLMAKTLNAVVSGSSFVPSFVGADYLTQTLAFSAGRVAQSLINRKNIPKEIPLTDTELIELAALVEDLQDRIIDSYYNYKSALNTIKETRQRLLIYHRNYSNALEQNDLLEITISSTLYDDMVMEEYKAVQCAKKYHLELQRLAGKKAVDNLNLYQYNFNKALFKAKGNKK